VGVYRRCGESGERAQRVNFSKVSINFRGPKGKTGFLKGKMPKMLTPR